MQTWEPSSGSRRGVPCGNVGRLKKTGRAAALGAGRPQQGCTTTCGCWFRVRRCCRWFPVVTGASGSFPPCLAPLPRRGAPDFVLKPSARWSGVRLLEPSSPSLPKSECLGYPRASPAASRALRPFLFLTSVRVCAPPPCASSPRASPSPPANSKLLLVFENSVC